MKATPFLGGSIFALGAALKAIAASGRLSVTLNLPLATNDIAERAKPLAGNSYRSADGFIYTFGLSITRRLTSRFYYGYYGECARFPA